MGNKQRFQSVRSTIQNQWPLFAGLYSTLVLALLFIGLGLVLRWFSLSLIALAIGIVAGYLLVANLWIIRQMYGEQAAAPAEVLAVLSQLQPEEQVASIDLGLRETPMLIAQYLTTGEMVAIDVFNPQSNNKATLRRARNHALRPGPDPRITWSDGSINLLPLPNNSVAVVYLNEILSEFWLPQEQERLLTEVWRILAPEGRLVVAEKVRSASNLFMTGLLTASWPATSYWRSLLASSGFIIQREETRQGLLLFIRAKKPSPASAKQMKLGLEY